jgi:hypothetical protein
LLTKNKLNGLWAVAPARLDYEYVEKLLKRAEMVRDAVRSGEAPDRIADRSECRACPWRMTCLPGDAPIDPLLIAEDQDLIQDLVTRSGLAMAAKEYNRIDENVKERFRLTAGDRFVAGDFLIRKKPHGKGLRVIIERLQGAKSLG